MSSFPYTVVTSDLDSSGDAYFGYTTFLIDAAAGNITITFPDATTGNDGSFFVFRRHDSSGPGTNTVTLAASNGQNFVSNATGSTVSTLNMNNNTTQYIICVTPEYWSV
jgi:asparagine N-glycosylation enzyme membrane subunit Stt3